MQLTSIGGGQLLGARQGAPNGAPPYSSSRGCCNPRTFSVPWKCVLHNIKFPYIESPIEHLYLKNPSWKLFWESRCKHYNLEYERTEMRMQQFRASGYEDRRMLAERWKPPSSGTCASPCDKRLATDHSTSWVVCSWPGRNHWSPPRRYTNRLQCFELVNL